jgi:hypothetical protein
MLSYHTLIICLYGFLGFLGFKAAIQSAIKPDTNQNTNQNTLITNTIAKTFAILNIVCEVIFFMIVSYKFPLIMIIVAIQSDPILNYLIYKPVKYVIDNLIIKK